MANTTSGGGGGTSGGGSSDGGSTFITRIFKTIKKVPEQLSGLTSEQLDTLATFAKHPKRFVRGIIFGTLLSGIAALLKPVFAAIELVFLGSDPATFAAPGETFGLVDLPVVVAGIFGSTVGGIARGFFEAIASVIAAAVPQVPGPVEGIIAAVVFAMLAVGFVRIGIPLIRAGLEAVPVVGGPLSTLLGKL